MTKISLFPYQKIDTSREQCDISVNIGRFLSADTPFPWRSYVNTKTPKFEENFEENCGEFAFKHEENFEEFCNDYTLEQSEGWET